jgi:hypothetical protein
MQQLHVSFSSDALILRSSKVAARQDLFTNCSFKSNTCNNQSQAILQKLLPTAVLIQADLDELLSLSLLLTYMLQLLLMKLQLSCLELCLLLLQGQRDNFSAQSERMCYSS